MKSLKFQSFAVAALWTVFLVFAVMHNTNNKRFPVVHFQGNYTEGYEARLPYYQLESSPAWAWDHNKSVPVILGYVFLALMWASTIFVALDFHVGIGGEKSSAGKWIVFTPIVLSVVFFFAGYSSRLVSNYVSIEENTFNQWVQDGKIEKRGQDKYIDVSEDKVLLHSFDNKNIIK